MSGWILFNLICSLVVLALGLTTVALALSHSGKVDGGIMVSALMLVLIPLSASRPVTELIGLRPGDPGTELLVALSAWSIAWACYLVRLIEALAFRVAGGVR